MASRSRSWSRVHWTAEELTTLRREWALVSMRRLRDKLPGRSTLAIRRRAHALGLDGAQIQGLLALTTLAQKFGFARPTMLGILERAGVKLVRRHPGGSLRENRRQFWKIYADETEAREAFERWAREETAQAAARRVGVCARVLRKRALDAELVTFGAPARLQPEQWDELASVRRRRRRRVTRIAGRKAA